MVSMRKLVAILLIVLFPTVTVLAQTAGAVPQGPWLPKGEDSTKVAEYGAGYTAGQQEAKDNYSAGGWFAAGLGCGFLGNFLGTAIITVVSQSGTVKPPPTSLVILVEQPGAYQLGYYEGYSKKAKGKRLGPTIAGGVVGTAAAVGLLYLMVSSLDDDSGSW